MSPDTVHPNVTSLMLSAVLTAASAVAISPWVKIVELARFVDAVPKAVANDVKPEAAAALVLLFRRP